MRVSQIVAYMTHFASDVNYSQEGSKMNAACLAMGLFFSWSPSVVEIKREVTVTKTVELSDQSACEEECKRMIQFRRMHVFKTPAGCFEGCGISRSKDVPTCRPNRKMRLTGDCTIQKNGWFYRCRVWR